MEICYAGLKNKKKTKKNAIAFSNAREDIRTLLFFCFKETLRYPKK
jgi:hypothetical protein